MVGAQRRPDEVEIGADDAILIEDRHTLEPVLDGPLDERHLGLALDAVRVEARLEEAHQQGCERRVGDERLLDVALAEGHAQLEDVLAVGAQHDDLAHVEAGREHEPVEAVVLDPLRPDAVKGLLELEADRVDVDLAADQKLHAEIVDPELAAVPGGDVVRLLGQDAQAHALEDRQHVGEAGRVGGPDELEVDERGRILQPPVEAHRQPVVALDAVDVADVGHGRARRHAFLVGGRQVAAVEPEEPVAVLLAHGVLERVAQPVGPGMRGLGELALEILGVEIGRDALGRADREENPGQHRFGELDLILALARADRRHEDRLQPLAQGGVVAVARDVDEAGEEAAEGIGPDEEPDPLALLQMEDLAADAVEQLGVGLEELVARIGLEDVDERLAVVAGGRVAGPRDDRLDLAAEQRDLARAAVVGGRGEEAEEAMLARDAAVRRVALDADHVEIGSAMHGAARRALGDQQRCQGIARALADRGRQGVEAPRSLARIVVLEDAEAAALDPAEVNAAPILLEPVLGVAEKGEMVVGEPAQERLDLEQLLAGDDARGRCQARQPLLDLGLHRPPVIDALTDVVEHAIEVLLDLIHGGGVALPVDLDMHEALARAGRRPGAVADLLELSLIVAPHAEDRMHDEMDAEPVPAQLQADAVDEEGHVVVDDLEDRVRGLPAMLLDARIVETDLGAARGTLLAEAEVGKGSTIEVERLALREVGGRHVMIVAAYEALDPFRLLAREALTDDLCHPIDKLGLEHLRTVRHGPSLPAFSLSCKKAHSGRLSKDSPAADVGQAAIPGGTASSSPGM